MATTQLIPKVIPLDVARIVADYAVGKIEISEEVKSHLECAYSRRNDRVPVGQDYDIPVCVICSMECYERQMCEGCRRVFCIKCQNIFKLYTRYECESERECVLCNPIKKNGMRCCPEDDDEHVCDWDCRGYDIVNPWEGVDEDEDDEDYDSYWERAEEIQAQARVPDL